MSAQETRNDIVRELLPKLVSSLTGFKENDENLTTCENFAWSVLRTHRNISTNSHEVRRRIEGIQDKFSAENCAEYAENFGTMCEAILTHPLCLNHYELDVHWSLIDFLISVAYNPAAVLRKNKHKIKPIELQADEEPRSEHCDKEYWKNLLNEDLPPLRTFSETESDLSDWSDDESKEKENLPTVPFQYENASNVDKSSIWSNIRPPEKAKCYTLYDGSKSKENIETLTQHPWWLKRAEDTCAAIESKHSEANVAEFSIHLQEENHASVHITPATATEHCLLREIIWMFFAPKDCFFFAVEGDNIKMCENVSVPSLTTLGLCNYVDQNILPYIRMMHSLRIFIETVQESHDYGTSKTVECYTFNLNALLDPFRDDLIKYEDRLINQTDFQFNTVLDFQYTLGKSFKYLEIIYKINQEVGQKLHQLPAHVASAFVLTRLLRYYQEAINADEVNITLSLFLSTLKIYLGIIDNWWAIGRLGDWQNEFALERKSNVDQGLSLRPFHKDKDISFFVPEHVTTVITTSKFFNLIVECSMEAGYSLNMLYDIDRVRDLNKAFGSIGCNLYKVFINKIIEIVHSINGKPSSYTTANANTNSTSPVDKDEFVNCGTELPTMNKPMEKSTELLQNNFTTTDEFLLFAFSCNYNNSDKTIMSAVDATEPEEYHEWNALQILQYLHKNTNVLQIDLMILDTLGHVLRERVAFTDAFVVKLYHDELSILKHFENIRKVFLLESPDLVNYFCEELCFQIETNAHWANANILTACLDDVISAKFSWMAAMFRIKLKANKNVSFKVTEAVDDISVIYSLSQEISYIISEDQMTIYNDLLHFLLKVKWALMTLNNLRFSNEHKRKNPHEKLDSIDLTMRRLELLRLWMMYAIQNVHCHLMTTVLDAENAKLDAQILNCKNLTEMQTVHKNYINTVRERCFLKDSLKHMKLGIEQLLSLVIIVKLEWRDCIQQIKLKHPLAITVDESIEGTYRSEIDQLEVTYIRIHQYLADALHNEVYLNHRYYLTGLDSAFYTSVPY